MHSMSRMTNIPDTMKYIVNVMMSVMAKVSSRTYSGKKPNDMSFLIKTASEGTQKYYAVTEGKS